LLELREKLPGEKEKKKEENIVERGGGGLGFNCRIQCYVYKDCIIEGRGVFLNTVFVF
jgi:hypothetical protein